MADIYQAEVRIKRYNGVDFERKKFNLNIPADSPSDARNLVDFQITSMYPDWETDFVKLFLKQKARQCYDVHLVFADAKGNEYDVRGNKEASSGEEAIDAIVSRNSKRGHVLLSGYAIDSQGTRTEISGIRLC